MDVDFPTALSTAAASGAHQSTTSPAQAPRQSPVFEVDFVYPRNETYSFTDTFPIVLVFQNPLAAAPLGRFYFYWSIMPYGDGDRGSGVSVQGHGDWQGWFTAANFTSEPYYLIDVTNSTGWHKGLKNTGPVHRLQWGLQWDRPLELCGHDADLHGKLFFTMDRETGTAPDISKAPSCPAEGLAVEILHNITDADSCRGALDMAAPGNPCAINLDAARISSISSVVSSLATPPPTAATTSTTPTAKPNSASRLAPRLVTALAMMHIARAVLGAMIG